VSRTLLRPSPRLRKQNPPRLRRLRSGRYPYQSRRELTLPAQAHLWGPLVRRVRLGQGDPEAPVVRVRRWARPGLGRQHLPAGPAVRLIRAARVDQLPRARRLAPVDRQVLAAPVRPADRRDRLDRQGQFHQAGPGGPCGPGAGVQAANAVIAMAAAAVIACRISASWGEAKILHLHVSCRQSEVGPAATIIGLTVPHQLRPHSSSMVMGYPGVDGGGASIEGTSLL
jgi:hypothetical protein